MPDQEYLSYKAINVFIERDYLEGVLRGILEGADNLTKEDQIAFTQLIRKYISVLGFRNPVRAPLTLQTNAYASAFEEKEEIIPPTLTMWTKLNLDFALRVKNWLEGEGWENLALERIYEESGGFVLNWPEELTFDQLEKKFRKANPEDDFDRNDLILMVLWISGTLPKD